jgi:Ca2+-binding EF-hand superfamily protein
LSVPIKEKLFALMDKNQIGLVDYPNFLEIINLSSAFKINKGQYNDNFDWENDVIEKIKHWIHSDRITIEEAFKSFDKDFDGYVNKEDLKWSLIHILKIKEEEIFPTKLDRLFRLLDFYKTG